VREFQSVIGREAKEQVQAAEGKLPKTLIACVGGGSNSIGLFDAFRGDDVEMIGVEAGGAGIETGKHAARFAQRGIGVLHGTYTYLLQDEDGQVRETHSISAGLDYPAVGPEHAEFFESERAGYTYATDDEALDAFQKISQLEGIIPALESAHAVAEALKRAPTMSKEDVVIVNLSGRGDKDLQTVMTALERDVT
jgi:tryptophan synthase beta chain